MSVHRISICSLYRGKNVQRLRQRHRSAGRAESSSFRALVIKSLLNIDNVFNIKSMENKLSGRGGAGRGQGRKPKEVKVDNAPVAIRMSTEQRQKLARLGGASWVREKIDKAKLPSE
ncbi:hypothetical protein [Rhodoferax sp.]|uniref:hypothetical protein n=1 Tax=Rhodoferax sp. TaxID=50421 RepID=UPI00374DE1E8